MGTNKQASPDISNYAKDVGARLLQQVRDELNSLKVTCKPPQTVWGSLKEAQQDEVLDRVGRRIRHELERGYREILANDVPAAQATLKGVNFKDKAIVGTLEIMSHSPVRHELADAAGCQVLVILAQDLDAYLDSMQTIKADKDQVELDLDPEQSMSDEYLSWDDAELAERCNELAQKIGEADVVADDWKRAHLLDYIAYAEAKLDGDNGTGEEATEE